MTQTMSCISFISSVPIVQDYLSKVHFIEHDFIWVCNMPEPRDKRDDCDDTECKLVVPF